ncbi:MAG: S8 family serine peptidase, partial [Pyrinomonadaceae bacterium]
MRYVKAFALVIVIAALLVVTRTAMQQSGEKQLPGNDPVGQPVAQDSMRAGDLGTGTRHKYIINQGDEDVYAEFSRSGAITQEIDYGSFRLIIVDEAKIPGGRAELAAARVPVRDDMDLIGLNGYILDTNNPATTYNRLPAELRQGDMANALARGGSPQGGLYLVQFAGPIKDDWLDEMRSSGVSIVSYVPNNAYIVRGDAIAAANLMSLRNRGFVQFLGDYEAGFRLSPTMQRAYAAGGSMQIDVTVQVVDSRGAAKVIEQLRQLSSEFVQEHQVMNYRNVQIRVPVSALGEIARMADVFAIEERVPRQRMDEAQGQIVAGNLTGNSPSGPGYLTWLAGKGFTNAQFTTFAVNVADDAYSLSGHPDLPAGRIAFQNNPTAQAGAQGGHGFLNSHIVGGFNNGTGSANEDANGYNYGVGISPFARVGITAIFGNGAATPTAWESTAYLQSARISSNSWGFQTVFRYDANAQEYDRIVRDAQTAAGNQQLAVVFAAGNDGSGSNTVSSPGTAKNVITVGASENVRQTGSDGCAVANSGADSANDIINFSSRGPVNSAGGDGRIKPEIVAPGTHIEAGIPQSNYDGSSVCNQYWPAGQTLYGWSSGTSHSCPAVAGGS